MRGRTFSGVLWLMTTKCTQGADATRPLPREIYTAADVRRLDEALIASGIAAGELMARAGAAAWQFAQVRWPTARRIAVVCGGGNNGGDGWVIARLALASGCEVEVHSLVPVGQLRGLPAHMAQAYLAAGGRVAADGDVAGLARAALIIDALFGIGLDRPPQGAARHLIEAINAAPAPVLAVDVPSGLHADSGAVLEAAVRAEATMSFVGLKLGPFTGQGPDIAGTVGFSPLASSAPGHGDVQPLALRVDAGDVAAALAPRARTAHKGDAGRVLIVGGAAGTTGAVRMSGEAALRAGSGLVSVATAPAHAALVNIGRPEMMVHGVADAASLVPLLARQDVLAVGPGLGQDGWAQALWQCCIDANGLAKVVDADGLNLLARQPARRDDWILTPHPGEAARLLESNVATVQHDRVAALQALQARYGGTVLLKGAGTLVGDGQQIALIDAGNPGMASGGMGDLLTGLIASLRGQGLSAFDAARLGAWIHATAGDEAAAAGGERGLLAGDLLAGIRRRVNP